MQTELQESHPELNISLLSINKIAAESGVASFNTTHNLPMVQDDTDQLIWDAWQGNWRDVYILDKENKLIEIYNLTEHNLNDPLNYEELKSKLITAAEQ